MWLLKFSFRLRKPIWTKEEVGHWAEKELDLAPEEVMTLVKRNVSGKKLKAMSEEALRACGLKVSAAELQKLRTAHARKRKLEPSVSRPVIINSEMALDPKHMPVLVLDSYDSQRMAQTIEGDHSSKLRKLLESKGFITVMINGDLLTGDKKWKLIEESLIKIPFVQSYVEKKKGSSEILDLCCIAFTNENLDSLNASRILICIDESQNFQKLNQHKWTNIIRALVRNRHDVHVICASSEYDLFSPNGEILEKWESPFEKSSFYSTFFSEKQIKKAITILQGRKGENTFVDLSPWKSQIAEKIFAETAGYPALCATYFDILRTILMQIESSQYKSTRDDFLQLWVQHTSHKLITKLNSSRLNDRIAEQVDKNLQNKIEESGILYVKSIDYNKDLCWQKEILRLGIAKLEVKSTPLMRDTTTNKLVLSCPIAVRFYLQATSKFRVQTATISSIENICSSPGIIDEHLLIKTLFKSLGPIAMKEGWVTARFNNKVIGSSEKQYQAQFFSILNTMCTGSTFWLPVFEMSRGRRNKVDIGLSYSRRSKLWKYLIELAFNSRDVGDKGNSAESHYQRLTTTYAGEDVKKSFLIIIYTQHPPMGYWWPKENHPKIVYVIVEHFGITDPSFQSQFVKILYSSKETDNEVVYIT